MPDPNSKEKVTDAEILSVFRETTDPVLATGEVADRVPLGRRGTLNRLDALAEGGKLRRKKLSKRSLVWWDPRWTTVGDRCVLCDDPAEYELTTKAVGTNPVVRLIRKHDRFTVCGKCTTALVGLREALPAERVFVDRLGADDQPIPTSEFVRRGLNEADGTNESAAEKGREDR
ncbi:hypothetical protein [Haladaptatus salinisoli]|uniref:hypothetical protein n=1 Tax=Haladaptatus salinisoli TaxID=2884876 RepID=UPI001D0A6C07|nr:hypothetical protein [Haladaptatus salinisoli]